MFTKQFSYRGSEGRNRLRFAVAAAEFILLRRCLTVIQQTL
ncbi:hypothetical protein [Anabaenopsis elenkinii]|nr:hypothetical protein [Anabaenopsis elenkinii]